MGVDGAEKAASRLCTRASRLLALSSSQHAMKPTWKSFRASGPCICATGAHARSAGEGDSRSSSTESRRIHSTQSSLVTR